jgi:hypothetical protein
MAAGWRIPGIIQLQKFIAILLTAGHGASFATGE